MKISVDILKRIKRQEILWKDFEIFDAHKYFLTYVEDGWER